MIKRSEKSNSEISFGILIVHGILIVISSYSDITYIKWHPYIIASTPKKTQDSFSLLLFCPKAMYWGLLARLPFAWILVDFTVSSIFLR